MAQVILAALGSAGDVFPFIEIGAALKAKRHDVTLITSERYGERVLRAGLKIHSLKPVLRSQPGTATRDIGRRITASRKLMETGARGVYQAICNEAHSGQLVVAANTWCLGARFAQEKLGIPLVSVHGMPAAIRSIYDTPVYFRGFERAYQMGAPMKRLLLWLIDNAFFDFVVAKKLNSFRRAIDLPAISWSRDPGWMHSPRRVIGLWPERFADIQPDWPKRTVLGGFVRYCRDPEIEPHRIHWMTQEGRGQGHVIFNLASWIEPTVEWIKAVEQMTSRLNVRALILSAKLPVAAREENGSVVRTGYVPMRQLMPGAKAVIHNGGIGTAAHAFQSGVPQVVIPISGDHFDNCARIVRLGAGVRLGRRDVSGDRLADAVQHVLKSDSIQEHCRGWQARSNAPEIAVNRVCGWIEEAAETWPAHSR